MAGDGLQGRTSRSGLRILAPAGPDENRAIASWVSSRIQNCRFLDGYYQAVAVVRGDTILAGVVYHDYRHPDIQMSVAADSPFFARPEIIKALFSYPFYQLRCTRATGIVNKKNRKSRKLIEHIGFKLEGVHPKAGHDGSTILSYGLLKERFEEIWANG